jgi:hypothetical protein
MVVVGKNIKQMYLHIGCYVKLFPGMGLQLQSMNTQILLKIYLYKKNFDLKTA